MRQNLDHLLKRMPMNAVVTIIVREEESQKYLGWIKKGLHFSKNGISRFSYNGSSSRSLKKAKDFDFNKINASTKYTDNSYFFKQDQKSRKCSLLQKREQQYF